MSTLKAASASSTPSAATRDAFAALRASKDPALFTVRARGYRGARRPHRRAHRHRASRTSSSNPMADGVASIIIGLILGAVAAFMSVEIRSLIVGEAASPALRTGLRDIIRTEVGRGTADPRHQRDPHHASRAATTCWWRRASISTTGRRRRRWKRRPARLERAIKAQAIRRSKRLFLEVQSAAAHAEAANGAGGHRARRARGRDVTCARAERCRARRASHERATQRDVAARAAKLSTQSSAH